MSARATRIIAGISLAVALVSLTISGWTAMTLTRQDAMLRELAEDMRARVVPGDGDMDDLPMQAPPPELETEP